MRKPKRTATGLHAAQHELRRVLADLVEVAVWTSPDGRWQEHASFLLGTGDGRWHQVGFADPEAAPLVAHLLTLPGFRREELFELLGPRVARVHELWCRPPVEPVDAAGRAGRRAAGRARRRAAGRAGTALRARGPGSPAGLVPRRQWE